VKYLLESLVYLFTFYLHAAEAVLFTGGYCCS